MAAGVRHSGAGAARAARPVVQWCCGSGGRRPRRELGLIHPRWARRLQLGRTPQAPSLAVLRPVVADVVVHAIQRERLS
jgi:hypothetical protein